MTDRILATYLLETTLELERAVRALASEGSTGTFVAVPGETDAVRTRFGTRLEALEELEPSDRVQLIGARGVPSDGAATVRRARVTVSVPLELTGTDLAAVGACLLGNVFELSEVSGLRLESVRFPEALLRATASPARARCSACTSGRSSARSCGPRSACARTRRPRR
jgi:ribulose-bisphosphate carboxylase large chain